MLPEGVQCEVSGFRQYWELAEIGDYYLFIHKKLFTQILAPQSLGAGKGSPRGRLAPASPPGVLARRSQK